MSGPSKLYPNTSMSDINLSLAMDNIITTIPKLSLGTIPYNLRPSDKKMMENEMFGGIGKATPIEKTRRNRGRKSDLSKDQLNVVIDIVDGRQLPLKGVLRAAVSPYLVTK